MTTLPPTDPIDYGKSTLFRFAGLNVPTPKVATRGNTSVVIQPPTGMVITASPTVTTTGAVVALNPTLVYFGEWLATNNKDLVFMEVLTRLDGITPLSDDNEATVWKNLYDQFAVNKDSSLTPKLVNLLRANEFAKEFSTLITDTPDLSDWPSDDEKHHFEYVSRAMISIPQDQVPAVPTAPTLPAPSLFSPTQQQALKKTQRAAIAKYQLDDLTKTLQSFRAVRNDYNTERTNARTAASDDYNARMKAFTSDKDFLASLSSEPLSAMEGLTLPQMEFDFPAFNTTYIGGKTCYPGLGDKLTKLQANGGFCGNVDKFEDYCNEAITKATAEYYANLRVQPDKVTNFKGHVIVSDNRPAHNSFVVQAVKLLPGHEHYSLVFTYFSRNGAFKVGNVTGLLHTGAGEPLNAGTGKKLVETIEYTSYVLAENLFDISSTDEFVFDAEVTPENGDATQEFSITVKKGLYFFGPQPSGTGMTMQSGGDGYPGIDNAMYGIKKIGIKDYLRVEQEICCYVPGEVSHIENVMAREFRKKLVRDLERQEITTEESEDTENEHTTDTSTTDRYEMHKEISQMLSKQNSQQLGVTAGMNASWDSGPKISINAGTTLNLSNSQSSTNNQSQAESVAKEITTKATERILKKISYKRTAKMLREHEETNEHGFDNRSSGRHVTGIYRWVDKIYKNTIYNYGKRLQYDFMIPEPSKNFKYWMTQFEDTTTTPPPVPPKYPGEFVGKPKVGFSWTDISETVYADIAAEYGADVEAAPPVHLRLGLSISETPQSKEPTEDSSDTTGAYVKDFEIPDGYRTSSFFVDIKTTRNRFKSAHDGWWAWLYCTVGGVRMSVDATSSDLKEAQFHDGAGLEPFQKKLPVSISCYKITTFNASICIDCWRTDEAYDAWRQKTYGAIMDAYNKKMQSYKDAMIAATPPAATKFPDYNYNPEIGRALEQRELKRLCIETMTLQLGLGWSYARENYLNLTTAVTHTTDYGYLAWPTQAFDTQARLVNFLEQAFEWDLISYIFYPYMYGDRGQWEQLIKQKSTSDPLFEAFLQSGIARVSLTVRPGFEKQVMFFLDTGTIPVSDDFVPGGVEDWYKSIVDLLKVEEKVAIGDPWETRVPTDLVILQSDAQPLQQVGLPCACDTGEATHGLGIGTSEMAGYNSEAVARITSIENAIVDIIAKIAEMKNGNSGTGSGSGSGDRTTPTPPKPI